MAQVLCPDVVGRGAELAALERAVRDAGEGRGGVLVLRGDAGLGKSRLVREAADRARARRCVVATGRCGDAAATVPLRPLTEAVSRLVRDRTVPPTPLLEPYRRVLARLAPDLLPPGEHGTPAAEPDPVHLGEGLLRLLRVLGAGRGALLVVEDLHGADPTTLAVVEHLADAVSGAAEPVSLLLTLRGGPSAGLDLVDVLTSRRAARCLLLEPLDPELTTELVRSCLPDLDDATVGAVVGRSGGVPLLAEELLAAALDAPGGLDPSRLASLVPLSFADGVRRRAAALGAPVQALLTLAAVAGHAVEPDLLAVATGRPRADVVSGLEAACAAQLLVSPDPCTFRHALTRDALRAGVLPTAQTRMARDLLAAAVELDLEPHLVAALAEAAEDRGRAARAWLALGRDAVRRGLPSAADDALRRAEQHATAAAEPALAQEAAVQRLGALALAGRAVEALELAGRLQGDDAPADAVQRRTVHLIAARAALDAGLLHRAEAELAGCAPADAEATAVGALVALADGRLPDAARRSDRVLADRSAPPAARCEALEVRGRLLRPHDLPAAGAAFAQAHRLAVEAALPLWQVRALHELGTVDMFATGRPDRLQQAHEAATSLGALTTRAVLDVQISSCLTLALDPERGLERAAAAAELAELTGARPLAAAAAFAAALAHAVAGRPDEADRAGAAARRLSGDDPETLAMLGGLVQGLGGLLTEDRVRAREGFRQLARLVTDAPRMPPTPGLPLRALLLSVEDHPDAGRARAQLADGGLTTVPANRMLLALAEAVAAGRAGDGDRAAQVVRQAAGDATGPVGGMLHDLGRRLVAEAAVADGWGEPVPWLLQSLSAFERTAPAVAAACRSLLRCTGAPVPRRAADRSVPAHVRAAGITARELEVLRLVADGAANRAVADRLHLSLRTVETHVARLLHKTGVAGRGQLRDWLAADGPVAHEHRWSHGQGR